MSAARRRAAFLVAELGRSGGMAVVRRHARHLRERAGWDAVLVMCDRKAAAKLPVEDSGVPVQSLGQAAAECWDAAIATWWTTTEALWELEASRRILFLQNIEHRFYGEDDRADRAAAQSVFALPVDFIVIADHMASLLRRVRPDARVELVRNGIDKDVFAPGPDARPASADDPLRVLIEGQPTLWFKGVEESLSAAAAMLEPATVTLAVHDPDDLQRAALREHPDRLVGGLDRRAMASLYAEHDVLLKLSRFEGSPLPTLEALHVGTPVVATPFSGHEDQLQHGRNALLMGFDDLPGTSRALDRLASDRLLLARLSREAVNSAASWPDQSESSAAFASAVERLVAEPPPSPDAALRAMLRDRRLATEAAREGQRRDRVVLSHTRGEVIWYRDAYEQTKRTAIERLEAIRAERAYRFAKALRTPFRRARRLRG